MFSDSCFPFLIDGASPSRESVGMIDDGHQLAIFIDFENIVLGLRGSIKKFDIVKVLDRMLEKGKVTVKKAYADWGRFRDYKTAFHESAIELIEIPKRSRTGKNSADIRMVVDAMDLSYSKAHIQTFVIVSGDSDFSPLVSKLKENGRTVIGVGMKDSTSELLRDNCDEFLYIEDIERAPLAPPTIPDTVPKNRQAAMQQLIDSIIALKRNNKETLYSSMIKDTIKRKRPQFDESFYGYHSFSDLLEDAERAGIIKLTTDARSGTYVVTGFNKKKP